MQVTVEEAKIIFSELCQLADAGFEVIITKDDQPFMKLVACDGISPSVGKKAPDRTELRDSLPSDAFKLLPGWDEPLVSVLESESDASK